MKKQTNSAFSKTLKQRLARKKIKSYDNKPSLLYILLELRNFAYRSFM